MKSFLFFSFDLSRAIDRSKGWKTKTPDELFATFWEIVWIWDLFYFMFFVCLKARAETNGCFFFYHARERSHC